MSVTGAASATPSPGATASASATYSTSGPNSSEVYAYVSYYFEVFGPAGVQVPIIVSASSAFTTSATTVQGYETGDLLLTVTIGNQPQSTAACVAVNYRGAACTVPSSFSVNEAFTTSSNILNQIQLSLITIVNAGIEAGSSAAITGYIDPVVTIDPAFARAGEFTLLFSAGVGNLPPTSVDEPSSRASLAAGITLLLLALRLGRARSRSNAGAYCLAKIISSSSSCLPTQRKIHPLTFVS